MTAFRPALFAPFADLAALRYDLPLVLIDDAELPARSLSTIVDGLLREVAPRGPGGERLRLSVLRLERRIRAAASRGEGGALTELWDREAARLAEEGAGAGRDLALARVALRLDGEVVDGDAASRLATHSWQVVHRRRSHEARARIDALIGRLDDLLRADLLRSPAGHRAAALRRAFSGPFAELFDLDAMSGLLDGARSWTGLGERERERIAAVLRVLREETFFRADPAAFLFHSVYSTLNAQRARTAAMTELLRAIASAERIVAGGMPAEDPDAPRAPGFFPYPLVALRTGGDPSTCAQIGRAHV